MAIVDCTPREMEACTALATILSTSVSLRLCVPRGATKKLVRVRSVPPPPPPLARLEVADIPGFAPLETRVAAGTVLVVVRLGDGLVAPGRAAEAAAGAWLARVALVAGKPANASEPWARQALACEVRAQLRPSMNDYWYREGRQAIPSTLAEIVAGKAPEREAFLFWRALRPTLGSPAEQSKVLIASARGESVLKSRAMTRASLPTSDRARAASPCHEGRGSVRTVR